LYNRRNLQAGEIMEVATSGRGARGPASGRVWDKYLRDQDRAAIGTRPHRRRGFGTKPALLCIDLYRWVFGDEPQPLLESMEKWPGSCGLAGWNALPHIQRLLAAARAAGIPIAHTRGAGDPDIKGWAPSPRSVPEDPAAADRLRRKFDFIDEAAPLPGELVVHKESPSGLWGTPLVGHLIGHGVDTILVAGESTSGCVRAAVVDGCTFRFKMIVVEECVFDRHEVPHAIELFTMNQKYADVIGLDEAVAYLDQWQETQQERVPNRRDS
jgi:nicotinamidase-related amidase